MPRELLFLCKVHIIRWLRTARASVRTMIEKKEKLEQRAACIRMCVWVSCYVHLINFALSQRFFSLSFIASDRHGCFFLGEIAFSYVSNGLGPSQDYKLNGYFSFGACVRSFIFRKINFGQKALGYTNKAGPLSLSTFWTSANFDTMMRECWPHQFGVPFHFAAVKNTNDRKNGISEHGSMLNITMTLKNCKLGQTVNPLPLSLPLALHSQNPWNCLFSANLQ